MWLNAFLVVDVDFLPPEFLQSELLLEFVLEESELGGEAEGGEDGLFGVEGEGVGVGGLFVGLGTLLDAVGLVDGELGVGLF
jgi:hypothetical protein